VRGRVRKEGKVDFLCNLAESILKSFLILDASCMEGEVLEWLEKVKVGDERGVKDFVDDVSVGK
jgi:hypothetical protein